MKWLIRGLAILAALLLIAFLVLRTPDTDVEEMRAKYGSAPSQFVELANGQTVHLRDEGPRDAPAIILLHGSNADLHTWQPWVEALDDDYRVIRYDQIGHGITGAAFDEDYTFGRYVEAVDLVAQQLDLDRFVLAGNSMGGSIAMQYAMQHPEKLDGLVLVDAGGADIPSEGSGNIAFTIARMPVIGNIMSQMLPRSMVERSLSQSVSNQDLVTPEAVDRYWELARYPGNRAATRARFAQGWQTFDAGEVSKVTVPTLVMWGEEDSLIPYEAATWYMEQLPNATLANYPGIGHLPQEEHAEKSVQDLQDWLQSLTPETAE